MKRIFALLLCLLILTGCHAAPQIPKEEPQPPVVQEEPEPISEELELIPEELEPVPEEPEPIPEEPELVSEEPEPIPEEPEPVPEEPEPAPVVLPSAEEIQAKTLQASICPCLAVEHAEWNLACHGIAGYSGDLLNGVMGAFSDYIAANCEMLVQAYGDFMNQTLWIIDHGQAGYYLQIVHFDDAAQQRVMFRWDGAEVTIFQEDKPLEGYTLAVCVDEGAECKLLPIDTATEAYYFRAASTPFGEQAITKFFADPEDPANIQALTRSETLCRISGELFKPQNEKPISDFLKWILQFDVSRLAYEDHSVGEYDMLLRDYFVRSFAGGGSWDTPYVVFPDYDYEGFWELDWMLRMLEEEMSWDPEFAASLLALDHWEVTCIGAYHHALTGYRNGNAVVTLTSSTAGIDSQEILTPSRKRVQQLAENGSRSELIPEEVKEDFIDYVMSNYHSGNGLSGRTGVTAKWKWSIQGDGVYMLKVEQYAEYPTEYDSGVCDVLKWEDGIVSEYRFFYLD